MKNTLLTTAIVTTAMLTGSASAATITLLGQDNTTGANWRTTTTAKSATFDPNGDNIYGNDGYFVGQTDLGAPNSNIETGRFIQSNPTYVSSIASGGAFFVSDNYIDFDNASLTPGASVTDVNGALYYNSGVKFTFDLSADSNFVLAVLVGLNPGSGTPTEITLDQTVGGSATATASAPSGDFDRYVFFEIDGVAGDTFTVSTTSDSDSGISGIAFETVPIPEPSSTALLGLGGLALILRRRK